MLVGLIHAALFKSLVRFLDDGWRDDLVDFHFIVDGKLPGKLAPGGKDLDVLLVPRLGSNPYELVVPTTWYEEPVHPFIRKFSSGESKLNLNGIFEHGLRFESSHHHAGLQLVDIVAYVTRNAILEPDNDSIHRAYAHIRETLRTERDGQALRLVRRRGRGERRGGALPARALKAPHRRQRTQVAPGCIPATPPTPRSAKVLTRRASVTCDFMGWDVPLYSAQDSAEALLAGRGFAMLACYLRHGDRVFETYWTRGRGFEVMAPTYGLLDMTVHGRQEDWEDSPVSWPQHWRRRHKEIFRTNGRPTAQWSRLEAGRSDDLEAWIGEMRRDARLGGEPAPSQMPAWCQVVRGAARGAQTVTPSVRETWSAVPR